MIIHGYLQLHNAHQLADWCMSYLCINYNMICKLSPKALKSLHPENQEYLKEHRWPPVWYLKDYDYYQRCMNELNRDGKESRKYRGSDNDINTCLCFAGGKWLRSIKNVWCFVFNAIAKLESNVEKNSILMRNSRKVFSLLTGEKKRRSQKNGDKSRAHGRSHPHLIDDINPSNLVDIEGDADLNLWHLANTESG